MQPTWSTACLDWRERIVAGKSLIPFLPLFQAEAEAALQVFKALKIVDMQGMPTFGEVCRPWVFEFVAAIFGAYDAETGRRLINEFFLLISKKNIKSTMAAGIMVTALIRNWRNSGEFLILAPTIEVASNSAKPAMDMVLRDEELLEILKPIPHLRTIEHRTTKATLKIVAADSEVVSGKKAIGVLLEELWLFGKMKNAENMLREATGGLASRPEGFVIALSTHSDEAPAGVFRDWLKRFRDIRDGELVAPRSLGLLYEFPEKMLEAEAYRDPKNFYITNPNLGASVDEQFLVDEMEKAKEKGLQSIAGFFAKHLNVEIGLSLRSDRWVGADYWEACGDKTLTLEKIIERCEICVVGIDGGGLDDLLGLVVLGRDRVTREWLHWGRAWAHESVFERRKDIATLLRQFEKDGDLIVVKAVGDDVAQVADIVERLEVAGLLPRKIAVGVDQAGIDEIVDELGLRGIAKERIGGVPQGWKLTNAIKTTERALAATKTGGVGMRHCAQRIMAWAVGNAKVEPRGNAIIITKQAAGSAKIDPLMATFDAVVAIGQNPEAVADVGRLVEAGQAFV